MDRSSRTKTVNIGFEKLPAGELTVIASGPRLNRKQTKVVTQVNETATLNLELTLASEKGGTIKVENLEVVIAEEATFLVAGQNEPLTLEQYIDYSREKLLELAPGWEQLKETWQDMEARSELETALQRASIHPGVLADVLEIPDADPFDVLAHVAYQRRIRTREARVDAFWEQEQDWLNQYKPQARACDFGSPGEVSNRGLESNHRSANLPGQSLPRNGRTTWRDPTL